MSHLSFLGIMVDGEICKGDARVAQLSLTEFEPLVRAVLDDETIHSFGWCQHTPYFNDGDPCIFSAGELWVKTTEDVTSSKSEGEEEGEGEYEELDGYAVDCHPTLGGREWDRVTREYGAYTGPDEARYTNCVNLDKAIQGGAFDNVLLEAFGDHAEIAIKRTGITIRKFSHD